MPQPLFRWTDRGLYCPVGDFYIDPSKGVDRAVVTHAHSDHARRGSRQYYCVDTSVGLMRARLGRSLPVQGIPYGEFFELGGARVSFHSAGHILGSAQVRVEARGQVWVASGDYKREPDPTCAPFEVVPCDVFVTEATFGTPAYVWQRSESIGREIFDWWQLNRAAGRTSVVLGYSLGKSQRILGELRPFVFERVWLHPTLGEITQCYRDAGVALCPTDVLGDERWAEYESGSLVIAPPSVRNTPWAERLGEHETAFASGWMSESRGGPGGAHEKGFVVSDHADWPDLLRTIADTGARHVYVLHRGSGALVRHLRAKGVRADSIEALRIEAPATDPRQTSLL